MSDSTPAGMASRKIGSVPATWIIATAVGEVERSVTSQALATSRMNEPVLPSTVAAHSTANTGRGSAYGCKPTPSIKLATNSDIYRRMIDDMDIDCGDILDGVTIAAKGDEIFATMLRVASGERTKSEELGYGDAEFVPWQIGAVM